MSWGYGGRGKLDSVNIVWLFSSGREADLEQFAKKLVLIVLKRVLQLCSPFCNEYKVCNRVGNHSLRYFVSMVMVGSNFKKFFIYTSIGTCPTCRIILHPTLTTIPCLRNCCRIVLLFFWSSVRGKAVGCDIGHFQLTSIALPLRVLLSLYWAEVVYISLLANIWMMCRKFLIITCVCVFCYTPLHSKQYKWRSFI